MRLACKLRYSTISQPLLRLLKVFAGTLFVRPFWFVPAKWPQIYWERFRISISANDRDVRFRLFISDFSNQEVSWWLFCMLQSTHKMANLTQNEICALPCSKRQYKQHDGEKMAMWNFAHSRFIKLWKSKIQIQTETFIKHVLPAKVRAVNRLKNTNHGTRKRQEWEGGGLMKKNLCVNEIKNVTSIIRRSVTMTLLKDAILNSKFKSVPLIPCSWLLSTLLYS